MTIRISAARETPIDSRLATAINQPHRKMALDPLDHRLECPLGRMRISGKITEREYDAGVRWRNIYHAWLTSIGAPSPFPSAVDSSADMVQNLLDDSGMDDEACEAFAQSFRAGERVLKNLGPRVFHAVGAVAVYEEPEELGEFEFTARAAKIGLAALADYFGH